MPASSRPADHADPADGAPAESAGYGAPFWFCYASHVLLMTACSMLFRYADLIRSFGGGELDLGLIVGCGMIGSLAMRLAQGVGIDRLGPRTIGVGSALLIVVACLGHVWVSRVDTPYIYILRMAYATSVAGAFGATITYVSLQAHPTRVATIIGTLGTSGFVGIMIGTPLADGICGAEPTTRDRVDILFAASAALALAAAACIWLATPGHKTPERRRQPSAWRLLRRYHPGPVLIMGVTMGVGLALPGTFLKPFLDSLEISRGGMTYFFWVYAPAALLTRMATRRLPERVGNRPVIVLAIGCMVVSQLLHLVVAEQWRLLFPAAMCGVAHALVFPAVVAEGSMAFPRRYRGLGTTLILASSDFGALIGGPLVGGILELCQRWGWPAYPTMYVTVSALMAAACVYFWSTTQPNNRAPADDSAASAEEIASREVEPSCTLR